jgi:hypothetical protein
VYLNRQLIVIALGISEAVGCSPDVERESQSIAVDRPRRTTRPRRSSPSTGSEVSLGSSPTGLQSAVNARTRGRSDFARGFPTGCDQANRTESMAAAEHPGWLLLRGRIDEVPRDSLEYLDSISPAVRSDRILGPQFRSVVLETAPADVGRVSRYVQILLPVDRVTVGHGMAEGQERVTSGFRSDERDEVRTMTEGREFLAVVRIRGPEQTLHVLAFSPVRDGRTTLSFLGYAPGSDPAAILTHWDTRRSRR